MTETGGPGPAPEKPISRKMLLLRRTFLFLIAPLYFLIAFVVGLLRWKVVDYLLFSAEEYDLLWNGSWKAILAQKKELEDGYDCPVCGHNPLAAQRELTALLKENNALLRAVLEQRREARLATVNLLRVMDPATDPEEARAVREHTTKLAFSWVGEQAMTGDQGEG